MSAKKGEVYPHERRVLRYAYGTLAVAAGLAIVLVLSGDGSLRGLEVPLLALLGLVAVGAVLGVVAVARRATPLALASAAVLVLAVLPGGVPRPSVGAYALGLLFGLSLLVLGELVHMTERYERAHRAVERDNVPEEHINRVTDEALKTLATRAGGAALAVAAAIGLAYALARLGPAQWRAATETSAPLGVAVAGLALAGATSLFILAQGAKVRLRREPRSKELLPDVAE